MNVALAIAIYAAAVSTSLGCWQIFSWWWQRRTRVEVDAFRNVVLFRDGRPELDHFVVYITNRSDHPVRVLDVSWRPRDSETSRIAVEYQSEVRPPVEIPPRDSTQMSVGAGLLSGCDLSQPVIVSARLSNGNTACSKPVMLNRRGPPEGVDPFADRDTG